MSFILLYLALGAVAGVLAGLLGIGGGLVIVPMLTFAFTGQGFPHEHILHMALGTSLASILFTSVSSMRSHHKRGAVIWPVVMRITPGILVGTFFGAWVASLLSTNFLKGFFGVFLLYVATQMLLGIKPKPTRDIPGTAGIFSAGSIIGIFSSLVGIGGGTLSVPFLVWCNTQVHKAIGTSSAIGFPIAVAGTLGFVLNGLGIENLPSFSLGYVNLGALAGIVAASVLTAPIGVKLAHSLPIDKLKKIFALLLYVVGTRMILSVFF
ncbi:sulfite exporter TauE/SafE family protein [Desulfospira joergensenii]|uniref:sulfite exporter TauE/SafE family protein n=1 Tax=Desulfospira joergensenii TaxID=53329 RepID=UPI0003B3E9FD|nr:sulfite exporter TauE/SafE family protein [Desulfospira joergensenii]